jgi:predicted Rossmann fold flavoprotein
MPLADPTPLPEAAPAVIVGGGPAGLFLAARLAALNATAGLPAPILLEKGPRPGRKLLASGSGRCNISHAGKPEDFLDRYGGKGRFLKKALYGFTNAELAAWLAQRGLSLEAEEGGKLFPASRRALDVLELLLAECASQGVVPRLGARVASVERMSGGFELRAEVAGEGATILRAPLVAIATGGTSYPATGSAGEGYALAESLGHRIAPPRPALAPVIARGFALGSLAGVSFSGLPFAIRRGGRIAARASGDVLITHVGLSGPGILDASRGIEAGDLLELDFSLIGPEAFRAAFMACASGSPRGLVRNALSEAGLPRRMAELFCSIAGLGAEAACADLGRAPREGLLRLATACPVEVDRLGGFDEAMATAGGVELSEVSPSTMESRIAPGLYFAGEVLDYDGDTGGFNLQAAFSTADLAARSISRAMAGLASTG